MPDGTSLRFSFVTPAYNEAEDIVRTLSALERQAWSDKEIIVIDDASTDETANLVQTFVRDNLRLIRHAENRGAAAARNTGVRAATGDVMVFVDADDVIPP